MRFKALSPVNQPLFPLFLPQAGLSGRELAATVRAKLAAAPDLSARHAVMDATVSDMDTRMGDLAGVLGLSAVGSKVRRLSEMATSV